jgi:hypothetical protein
MNPRPPAIRKLMLSPPVRDAVPVVRNWLLAILRRGERKGRRTEVFKGAKVPAREGNPGS